MPRRKNAFIASALAALMLSTACSTTEDITITAPGDTTTPTDSATAPDDTPTPTDGTTSPDGETGTPDDTPTGDGTTSPGDAPAPTDGTAAPGGETGTPDDTTETPVTASDQGSVDGQESEPAPFIHEYPEFLLINRNDRSTPLGKLCWAYWEYSSQQLARIHRVFVDNTPNLEVTFPAIADITEGEDNGVGPVGVVNEESNELSIGTDGYLVRSLDGILKPSVVSIVDDLELSEELRLFAEAFFAYIEAFEEQLRAVGYENIDRSQLPYQDFESMPYRKEFSEAFIANPDKCVIPSEDETNQFYDDLLVEVEEYLEETGGPVTIE